MKSIFGKGFNISICNNICAGLKGKSADQIIILKQGEIIEIGIQYDLTRSKGEYFELIKNQLELDN